MRFQHFGYRLELMKIRMLHFPRHLNNSARCLDASVMVMALFDALQYGRFTAM